MTREEAQASGFKRYLGLPCARGHAGWRYTTHGNCIECQAAAVKRQRAGKAAKRMFGVHKRDLERKANRERQLSGLREFGG